MSQGAGWKIRESDQGAVEHLSKELGLSRTVAKVLVNRKMTDAAQVQRFLHVDMAQVHSPFLFKDMDKAVARVVAAIESREPICVYGDYDVDGATATTLLVLFFEEVGYPVSFYIPNRLREGYSLNENALRHLKEQGTKLIITVDNGIMAHREIEWAQVQGLDVIVTDHHKTAQTLPQAIAVVNPQRDDCPYPFKGICGAGVAFKLMMALRQVLRQRDYFKNTKEPNLKQYLDLLAIATVCDVVPLVDENRYFVREGLQRLRHTTRPGLRALLQVCNVFDRDVTATDLGFKLGPRINACGRLEDATLGVLMLTTHDATQAMRYAKILDGLNVERRDIELSIVQDVCLRLEKEIDLDERLGIVLYDQGWHEGIVGIVASRIVEKYKRPVFILGKSEQGMIKGSGRSIPQVSLIRALNECAASLHKFGGHEAAAGVTLDETNLQKFVTDFDAAVKAQMRREDLVRTLFVDDVLTQDEINLRLIAELKTLEPFGMGNSQPLFALRESPIRSKRVVGEKHLKLTLDLGTSEIDAIAFNQGNFLDKIGSRAGMIFGLEINHFRDVEKIQLNVRHFF